MTPFIDQRLREDQMFGDGPIAALRERFPVIPTSALKPAPLGRFRQESRWTVLVHGHTPLQGEYNEGSFLDRMHTLHVLRKLSGHPPQQVIDQFERLYGEVCPKTWGACLYCHRYTTNDTVLRNHMRTQHWSLSITCIACDQTKPPKQLHGLSCRRIFKTAGDFVRHHGLTLEHFGPKPPSIVASHFFAKPSAGEKYGPSLKEINLI